MYIADNWYLDPQSGNDANSGLSGSPVKTVAELIRRWGTNAPVVASGQTVTVHLLSSQNIGTDTSDDPATIYPVTIGSGNFRLTGVPSVITSGVLASVVARDRASGQRWQAQIDPMNAAPYVGKLVHDTTVDAWFWVDEDLGGGIAALSEPLQEGWASFQAGQLAPNYINIANGDSFIIYECPHIDIPIMIGNDPDIINEVTGGLSAVFIDKIRPSAPSDYEGSVMGTGSFCQEPFFAECDMSGRYPFVGLAGITCLNCSLASLENTPGGQVTLIGGRATATSNQGTLFLDGDILLKNVQFSPFPWGVVTCGRVYFGGTKLELPSSSIGNGLGGGDITMIIGSDNYADGEIWGPIKLVIRAGGKLQYNGTAVGSILTSGGLEMSNGDTTAMTVDATTGTWTGGITLSPANLDTLRSSGGFQGYAQGQHGELIVAIT